VLDMALLAQATDYTDPVKSDILLSLPAKRHSSEGMAARRST
jgi:hypothetical protein